MRFEWDKAKNRANIRKHGLDFADADAMFALPIVITLDDRVDYGETRWNGIGMIGGRIVVMSYTERDEETIRIISLRKALRHERAKYEETFRNQLGIH